MRYHVMAIDYDGTLAEHDKVAPLTIEVLNRVKKTGRKLVLVTGRMMEDLQRVFPEYRVFDYIVAENGALIHYPESGKEEMLAHPLKDDFIAALKKQGVFPLSVGKVIAATWVPHEKTIIDTIKRFGLELQVIFNKGAVMILPPAVNKATGLLSLLKLEHFSIHNTVAIGDAENDIAMLEIAEYAVAVQNALQSLKERADFVTTGKAGAGVRELLNQIMENEHAEINRYFNRHKISLGTTANLQEYTIQPFRPGILVAGVSAAGKSTFTTAIAESLADAGYQFCLIDPEGDYLELPGTIVIGNDISIPTPEEITQLLKDPQQNLVVCMVSVPIPERPAFFCLLMKALLELRQDYGHPHWFLLDEAHHLLPEHTLAVPGPVMIQDNFILISTSPHILSSAILSAVETVITLGENEKYAIEQFCAKRHCSVPDKIPRLSFGEACVWDAGNNAEPFIIHYKLPVRVGQRHKRKYAHGDMASNSFIFTGPKCTLRLKANNLMMFVQLAEGIDDDTWLYHLVRHDYKNWATHCLKDPELIGEIKKAEGHYPDVKHSKKIILDYINDNYTVSASML